MSAPAIILASSSPRRREVLEQLGFDFAIRVAPPGTERPWDGSVEPGVFVREAARAKRDAVASPHPESIIVAADTVVVLGDEVLEKPADAADAEAMLTAMSGRRHEVFTGIAVAAPGPRRAEAEERTSVTFRRLGRDEIADYVSTGEPLDKAGAYGIQGYGAALVTSIEGCYFNVMGMPVARLLQLLREVGWEYRAPGRLRPLLEPI